MPFQSLVFPIIIPYCCLIFLSFMLKQSSHPSAFSLTISCMGLLPLPCSFLIPFFCPSFGHFFTYTLAAGEESLGIFHILETACLAFPGCDWPWLLKIPAF
jgi:hypothetical protein